MYEHPERPEQKVIDNDDLLDRWVEKKSKEAEENAKKYANSKGNTTSNAHDHDEVIIFDEEEWEEVLDEESEDDEE